MKKGIHPKYLATEIRCACGSVIETRSTKENISVQICSSCHPFYTGKQKLIDAAGKIESFNKKFAGKLTTAQKAQKVQPPKLVKKEAPKKSLQDLSAKVAPKGQEDAKKA